MNKSPIVMVYKGCGLSYTCICTRAYKWHIDHEETARDYHRQVLVSCDNGCKSLQNSGISYANVRQLSRTYMI